MKTIILKDAIRIKGEFVTIVIPVEDDGITINIEMAERLNPEHQLIFTDVHIDGEDTNVCLILASEETPRWWWFCHLNINDKGRAEMITIDNKSYKTKKKALDEMLMAMRYCEGSEAERMTFAYFAILDGCKIIDTYNETATR